MASPQKEIYHLTLGLFISLKQSIFYNIKISPQRTLYLSISFLTQDKTFWYNMKDKMTALPLDQRGYIALDFILLFTILLYNLLKY